MLGFRLFRHAVLILIYNLGSALRISVLPLFLLSAAVGLGGAALGQRLDPETYFPVVFLVAGAAFVLVVCLVAVGWHRFVLLSEYPRALFPAWRRHEMWRYTGALFRVTIGALFFVIPLGVLFTILAQGFGYNEAQATGETWLTFAFNTLATYVSVRLSLCLPAAALGKFMGIWQSWTETSIVAAPIFVAVVLVNVLVAVPGLGAQVLPGGEFGLGVSLVLAGWLQIMLSISIMTTIYGHIVEGRELR